MSSEIKKYPVIETLREHRVVDIDATDEGLVAFAEGCDHYFDIAMPPFEARRLAYEIIDLCNEIEKREGHKPN